MKPIGAIRRSQVISTYGPGAIIDFRSAAGAPVSAISTGLEDWDEKSIRKGLINEQVIYEPRLQKKLRVDGFRLPPVGDEKTGRKDKDGRFVVQPRQIPAKRFPDWHFCPSCNFLQPTRQWNEDAGRPELYCASCPGPKGRQKKQFVIPVRFVVACENGHLDEFPWNAWVGHDPACDRKKPLKLVTIGAGLGGLYVQCSGCKSRKSMGTAFSKGALGRIGHKCSGRSPWLNKGADVCIVPPGVIQRGASNAYFPIVESAIDIPPWGDVFQESLGHHWRALSSIDDRVQINKYVENVIMPDLQGTRQTVDEIVAKIELRLRLVEKLDTNNLRIEEYAHLCSGDVSDETDNMSSLQLAPEKVPARWNMQIRHLVRVERLREVRVLKGFTRLSPMEGDQPGRQTGLLSAQPKNWLPAIEVFGEGIFLGLDEQILAIWETRRDVQERVRELRKISERHWKERNGDLAPFPFDLSPRFLMIHTLAHAFIRRLSLDCGYSSASVRERLYVGSSGTEPMCGFLIYTSAPDSDGTLGGLSRQGRSERADETLRKAILDLEWCSSDPLCSDGLASFSDNSNLAACHSCSFLPETACEHFNRYLDRALVIGLPNEPELGFFNGMAKEEL